MTSSFATRLFGYVTLIACFVVGSAVVRFTTTSDVIVHLDRSYLNVTRNLEFASPTVVAMEDTLIAFDEIQSPKQEAIKAVTVKTKAPTKKSLPKLETTKVAKTTLPFNEPVTLAKVEFKGELLTNHLALYKYIQVEEVVAQAPVVDAVQTKMASNENKVEKVTEEDKELEAMFFEYPVEKETKKEESSTAAVADTETSKNVSTDEVVELTGSSSPEVTVNNLKALQDQERKTPSPTKIEEESVDQLLAFDYSSAQQDINSGVTPKVSWVDVKKPKTQKSKSKVKKVTTQKPEQEVASILEENALMAQSNDKSLKTTKVSKNSKTIIQMTSTNFERPEIESGFEVRFQDDVNDIRQDYGTGSVTFQDNLAHEKMTRSVVVLKRGFVPTNNELVLESGEATLSIPVIDEQAFNTLQNKYAKKNVVGAVLVEMDDQTEDVTIDVPFGEVVTLDGDLRLTTNKDYRYKLFLGVRAGNVLLSARIGNRDISSRIVHVHEGEVTFDANLYESVNLESLSLKEEELLMNGSSPLITSAERVRVFATEKTSKKINDRTYSLDFGQGFLASRRYVEVNHLSEPVFIGFRDNKEILVPSENFMTHVVRSIAGKKLNHHCVVQVNTQKVIDDVIVGTESVDHTLSTSVQMLDSNGKFYDSASDKTRKVIIAGESHASEEISKDSKINIKINYADGSVDYVGSYCSPNTYLVEQL